jgi:hypothetical protein
VRARSRACANALSARSGTLGAPPGRRSCCARRHAAARDPCSATGCRQAHKCERNNRICVMSVAQDWQAVYGSDRCCCVFVSSRCTPEYQQQVTYDYMSRDLVGMRTLLHADARNAQVQQRCNRVAGAAAASRLVDSRCCRSACQRCSGRRAHAGDALSPPPTNSPSANACTHSQGYH